MCCFKNYQLFLLGLSNGKNILILLNSEKDASRTKVIEMYPYIASEIARKKDSNKADAILIARYYFETQGN